MSDLGDMLQNALKMNGRDIIMRADMAKRGRKPLPAWLRRRHIYVRLLLPEQNEWIQMLKDAGYGEIKKDGKIRDIQTAFFQEWVDVFLAARPAGREFLKRASDVEEHGSADKD